MDKLPHMNDKRSFILQQYAFNVLVKDQFVFIAIVSLPPHTTPDTTRLVIALGDSPTLLVQTHATTTLLFLLLFSRGTL